MEYVTYDANGTLTGGYSQPVHPAHAGNYIPVTSAQRLNWTAYRANAARTGVDLVPPASPVAAVPQSVLMLNAHLVMIDSGWMPQVRQHIAAIADPVRRARAEAFLDQAETMQRNHELVHTITAALNKTEAEVDALFVAAAALEV